MTDIPRYKRRCPKCGNDDAGRTLRVNWEIDKDTMALLCCICRFTGTMLPYEELDYEVGTKGA
jgi:hypothetical protein